MATRATLRFVDKFDETLLRLYIHYDGYPEGWPSKLKERLRETIIVNGLSSRVSDKYRANGFGDLVLLLTFFLKGGGKPGNVYAYTQDEDMGQIFNYTLKENQDGSMTITGTRGRKETLYGFTETFHVKKELKWENN